MSIKECLISNLANHWNWFVFGVFLMVLSFVVGSTSDYHIPREVLLMISCSGILIVLGSIMKPQKKSEPTSPVRMLTPFDESLGSTDIIRTIHNDLSEDKREYDRLIFAIPSVVSAINAAFLGIAYGYIEKPIPRLVLLFTSIFLTLAIIVANIKHRYFSNIITENLIVLENRLKWAVQRVTFPERMLEITNSTSPNLRIDLKKPSLIERVSAHLAIRNTMIVTLGFLAALAIWELSVLAGFNLGI